MVDGSTRPFLRSEHSTTIRNTHQLQLMAMDLGANYVLANNIDFTGQFGDSGMWGARGFAPSRLHQPAGNDFAFTAAVPSAAARNGQDFTINGAHDRAQQHDHAKRRPVRHHRRDRLGEQSQHHQCQRGGQYRLPATRRGTDDLAMGRRPGRPERRHHHQRDRGGQQRQRLVAGRRDRRRPGGSARHPDQQCRVFPYRRLDHQFARRKRECVGGQRHGLSADLHVQCRGWLGRRQRRRLLDRQFICIGHCQRRRHDLGRRSGGPERLLLATGRIRNDHQFVLDRKCERERLRIQRPAAWSAATLPGQRSQAPTQPAPSPVPAA